VHKIKHFFQNAQGKILLYSIFDDFETLFYDFETQEGNFTQQNGFKHASR